jgi:hypothetical protein
MARKIRNENTSLIPNDYIFHVAFPVDEDSQLSPDFRRDLGHEPGSLGRNDSLREDSPPIEAFDFPDLTRLQAGLISINSDGDNSLKTLRFKYLEYILWKSGSQAMIETLIHHLLHT